METGIQILEFALGLIILIILHEFGHFLAARALKIEVEEFGLGFPSPGHEALPHVGHRLHAKLDPSGRLRAP